MEESWRKVFRDGLAPLLSVRELELLRDALANDDPRLVQNATTEPTAGFPPYPDWKVSGACLLCYPTAFGGPEPATVEACVNRFEELSLAIGRRTADCRAAVWLINAYDEWPRAEMIANLLPEVRHELARRKADAAGVTAADSGLQRADRS